MTIENQGSKEFTLKNGVAISEYFAERNALQKVTRGELAQLLTIFPTKADLTDAIQVIGFNLRQAVKAAVQAEQDAKPQEAEGKPVSRIILP